MDLSGDRAESYNYEEGLRAEAAEAFDRKRFQEAFAKTNACLLSRAIRCFREEGLYFHRPAGDHDPTAFVVGLAAAAAGHLATVRGEASNKMEIATSLLHGVAELRLALDETIAPEPGALADKTAQVIQLSHAIGQIDTILTAIDLGWLDKLAEFEVAKERRRVGANRTNAKKAGVKEQALAEAMRIAGRNPTLSNEELAVKIRESLKLATTVRTLTGWVREWRRNEFIGRPLKT